MRITPPSVRGAHGRDADAEELRSLSQVGVTNGVRPPPVAHAFAIDDVQRRLEEANGGYEIVHRSPRLEIGVYVLVAPQADTQQPHDDDEAYVVLGGRGTLEVAGKSFAVSEGDALFVEAGAEHRFTGYESLSVLVIFTRPD